MADLRRAIEQRSGICCGVEGIGVPITWYFDDEQVGHPDLKALL
jgi:hypothetical protein